MAERENILLIIIREDKTNIGVGLLAVLATFFAIGQLALIIGMIAVTPFVLVQTIICILITCLVSNSSNKFVPIICGLIALVATLAFDATIVFPIKENIRETQIIIGVSLLFSDIGTAITSYYVSRVIIKSREMKLLKQNKSVGNMYSKEVTLRISYKSKNPSIRMTLDIKPIHQNLLFANGSTMEFNIEPGRYIVRGKVGGFFSLVNERFDREIMIKGPEEVVNIDVTALPSATKNLLVDIY